MLFCIFLASNFMQTIPQFFFKFQFSYIVFNCIEIFTRTIPKYSTFFFIFDFVILNFFPRGSVFIFLKSVVSLDFFPPGKTLSQAVLLILLQHGKSPLIYRTHIQNSSIIVYFFFQTSQLCSFRMKSCSLHIQFYKETSGHILM